MYKVCRESTEYLKTLEKSNCEQTVFTTYAWVKFIEKNQKAEPVILQIFDSERMVAVFVGLIITKFGVRILGSPFEGWMTEDMGFIRVEAYDLKECLLAVNQYAFKELKCWYVQISDKKIRVDDIPEGVAYTKGKSLYLDLQRDEQEIFSSFKKEARHNINRFTRKGAILKEVPFDEAFVKMFYEQIQDVFAKQNLKPNYNLNKLMDLSEAFEDYQERVLAIQVYSPEKKCIASSVFLSYKDWCYSLVTASFREFQHFIPNEMIRWHGICFCKERGAKYLDFCGYREYKLKFSPDIVEVPTIVFYRYKALIKLKDLAKTGVRYYRRIKGKLLVHSVG